MATSGFVPAWMKISNSDKTNGYQKLNIDRTNNHRQLQNETIITGRQRYHSSDITDHTVTRQTLFYCKKTNGRCRNKSHEQPLSSDVDGQSENFFSFPSRRSYSRERVSNTSGKSVELTDNDSLVTSNNRLSNTNHQRRLHFLSSHNGHTSTNNQHNLINENHSEHLSHDDYERVFDDNHSDIITKSIKTPFDQLENDFPSLNGRDLSLNNNDQSSIWSNAASKFRKNEISSFKYFDHSLSTNNGNNSRTLASNHFIIPRKDRLLSTPNNFHNNSRSIIHELQTNCITQTKNLDKRSDFFNSLKNHSTMEGKTEIKRHFNQTSNIKPTKATLLLLSVSETSEEKEFLIRMGWNDDMTYEITDKDKEDYEKRIKLLPKTDNRSAALISTFNRRALPCINIQDIFQLESINSQSDDESSDD